MFNKKYFFSLMLLLATTSAFADYPNGYFGLPEQTTTGFYIAGQVGEGFKGIKSQSFYSPLVGDTVTTPAKKATALAGRLALGYDANPFVGFEFGGSIWERTNLSWNWNEQSTPLNVKADLNNSLIDLLVTLNLPVYGKFHVFGKGGLAYLFEKLNNSSLNHNTPSLNTDEKVVNFLQSLNINNSQHALAPELALGFGYQWSEHWDISLNYSHVFGNNTFNFFNNNNGGNSSNNNIFSSGTHFPTLSMLAVGVEWDI